MRASRPPRARQRGRAAPARARAASGVLRRTASSQPPILRGQTDARCDRYLIIRGFTSSRLATLDAERGKVDPVDGLVDLAADTGGEEVLLDPAEERSARRRLAREVG